MKIIVYQKVNNYIKIVLIIILISYTNNKMIIFQFLYKIWWIKNKYTIKRTNQALKHMLPFFHRRINLKKIDLLYYKEGWQKICKKGHKIQQKPLKILLTIIYPNL